MSNSISKDNEQESKKARVKAARNSIEIGDASFHLAEMGVHIGADIVAGTVRRGSATPAKPGFSNGGEIESGGDFHTGGAISTKAEASVVGAALSGSTPEPTDAAQLADMDTSDSVFDIVGGLLDGASEIAGDVASGAIEALGGLLS